MTLFIAIIAAVTVTNLTLALTVGWHAPTNNVDGSPVEDLASFNLYTRPDTNWTHGEDIVTIVPATNAAPAAGEEYSATIHFDPTLMGAWVTATAVDFAGNESDFAGPVLASNYTARPPPLRVLGFEIGRQIETKTPSAEPPPIP